LEFDHKFRVKNAEINTLKKKIEAMQGEYENSLIDSKQKL